MFSQHYTEHLRKTNNDPTGFSATQRHQQLLLSFISGQESVEHDAYIDIEDIDAEEEDECIELLNDVCGQTHGNEDKGFGESSNSGNNNGFHNFEAIFGAARQELYQGCTKSSTLTFIVKLMHIKVLNQWSNKSLDMLLQLLKEVFLDDNNIPDSYYGAKKMLRDLGLGYESIHACKYDCALFWKEYERAEKCRVCGEDRYKLDSGKDKKIPHKILRYFQLTPRFQRLFMSKHTTSEMRWHKEKRMETKSVLRHPADSETWKKFDKQYPVFA
ncbi:hypothetical protein Dsin_002279 [Dipteronia sinensis]|uniref:Transposase n=1 Tax=Dipteronia sinensis TaxID=43782 RepID=A0AAE0B5J0_9ROSI|nr:hypothetical protein Dsin_002279 [Dipteronia sinensis]